MIRRGYSPKLTYGVIAAGGTLGILIPPSIAMIIYGTTVGAPVTTLFIAGIVPGLLLMVSFMVVVFLWSVLVAGAAPTGRSYNLAEKLRTTLGVLPFVSLILLVLGSLYLGIATPTGSRRNRIRICDDSLLVARQTELVNSFGNISGNGQSHLFPFDDRDRRLDSQLGFRCATTAGESGCGGAKPHLATLAHHGDHRADLSDSGNVHRSDFHDVDDLANDFSDHNVTGVRPDLVWHRPGSQ